MPLVRTPYGQDVLLPDDYSQPADPATLPGAVVPGAPMPSGPGDAGYQPPQSVMGAIAPDAPPGPLGAPAGAGPLQIGQSAPPSSPMPGPQAVLPPGVSPGPSPPPPPPTVAGAIDKINGIVPPKPAGAPAAPGLPSLAQTTAMGVDALRDQQAANTDATDAQAKAADAANEARKAGYAEADRLQQQQNAQQAERMKQRATIDAHLQQMQKDADDYKIDPNGGVGLGERAGSLVGAALSGIGLSMMGKGDAPNPVIQMIEQHIKDGVARQMDQRAQLQKRADRGVDQLDRFDHFSSDLNAQSAAMTAQALQRTARQVELASGQYASADIRANGKKAAADLNAKAAELYQQAGNVAFDRADKDAQRKIAQQNASTSASSVYLADKRAKEAAAETARHNQAEEGLAARGQDLTLQSKEDALAAKRDATRAKSIDNARDYGIADAEGNPFYQPEGVAKLNDASQLETKAAATTDGKARAQLLQQAADLRDDAKANDTWTADKESAPKLRGQLAATQTTVEKIHKLRTMMDENGISDIRGNAAASALFNEVKAGLGKSVGARYNESTQDQLDKMIGGDPGTAFGVFDDAAFGRYKARLDEISADLQQQAQVEARRNHYRGPKSVIADPAAPERTPQAQDEKAILSSKTNEEDAQDAQPGILQRGLDRVLHPADLGGSSIVTPGGVLHSHRSNPDYVRDHEAPLSDEAAQHTAHLALGYTNADADGKARALSTLKALVSSDKPGLARAVYGIVRSSDAALADKLTDEMPTDRRVALGIEDKSGRPIPRFSVAPIGTLTNDLFNSASPETIAQMARNDPSVKQDLLARSMSDDTEQKRKAFSVLLYLTGGR